MRDKVSIFLYSEINEDRKNIWGRRNNSMLSFMQFLHSQTIAWNFLPFTEFERNIKVFLIARMTELSCSTWYKIYRAFCLVYTN